jgi:methionyl-tRNA formyltransferase
MTPKKILFMGRKPLGAKCLEFLLLRSDVEVVGVLTDSHLLTSPTADIANKYGLRLYEFDSALEHIKSGLLQFDLGLSVLYWRRLRDEFLTTPNFGIINFHPAPLPEYKGTAGYNLAILEGRTRWATTAHYVDATIDTGGIIEVFNFPIDSEKETAKSLESTCQLVLEEQFKRIVSKALSAAGQFAVTKNIGGRYVSRVEMELMKEIKPGDNIPRKIRAFWFPPYDGAYITIEGVKYTLVDSNILYQLGDASSSSLFTLNKLIPCD